MRRIWAMFMAFVLVLGCMTGLEFACNTPTYEVQAASTLNKNVVDLSNENYYVLSVETGATPGTDVLYFAIRYKDTTNRVRTDFIFPHEGAKADGFSEVDKLMAQAGNVSPANRKAKTMQDIYAVNTEGYLAKAAKALEANTIDEFFFTTNFKIKSIEGIDVCSAKGSNWYCESIGMYSVDRLKGIDMIGYYSNQYFIDFEGTLLARATFSNNIDVADDGLVAHFRIGDSKYPLQTKESLGGKIDTKHAFVSNYAVKIDIAQMEGAGIDAFIQSAESRKRLDDIDGIGSYMECLTLFVEYIDMSGIKRSVYIPLCLNMLCYLCDELNANSKYIYGLGQDSDSLFIPVTLPGVQFDSLGKEALVAMKLYYSNEYAKAKCGINYALGRTSGSYDNNGNGSVVMSKKEWRGVTEDDSTIAIAGVQLLSNMPGITFDSTNSRMDVAFNNQDILFYYVAGDYSGYKISFDDNKAKVSNWEPNCLNIKDSLSVYRGNENLVPRSAGDAYLVTIELDDKKGAETMADINVSLMYVDRDGNDRETGAINVRDGVNSIYGRWLTSGRTDRQGAYYMIAQPGASLQIVANIVNVEKFIGAKIKLESNDPETEHDEMSMKQIRVERLSEEGLGRLCYQFGDTATSVNGAVSKWTIRRDISLMGTTISGVFTPTVYGKNDCSGKGMFIEPGDEAKVLYFTEAERVEQVRSIDWYEYSESMTYAETKQKLGYTKRRGEYVITVDVPSDKGNDEGDSGSKNQFYFKLLFDSGNSSGYVLANQQLSSDCFKSGRQETFSIYTNYDYGEVVGVRIIPDAQQENSDIYDKLKIDTITVSEAEANATKNWICYVNGWVGIDYNDDGAATSAKGQTSRYESEIARTYPVSTTDYDVKLEFAVESAVLEKKEKQLTGSMTGILQYRDIDDELKKLEFDVYEEMYKYMGYVEKRDEKTKDVIIDQNKMLVPNSISYFTLGVKRAKKLVSIKFIASNATDNGVWRCSGITVNQVMGGTGGLYLGSDGVRVRDYDTKQVATTEGTGSKYLYAGNGDNANMTVEYAFTSEEILFESLEQATDSEDKIQDDSMNIYVHMMNYTENPSLPLTIRNNGGDSKYNMGIVMNYSYDSVTRGNRKTQNEVEKMNYSEASHMFYASIDVKGFREIIQFALKPKDESGRELLNAGTYADYAIFEHVKNGSIAGTYKVEFGTTDMSNGVEMTWKPRKFSGSNDGLKQELIIALGNETVPIELSRLEDNAVNDIGIALRYRSKYAEMVGDYKVYKTPVIYLSSLSEEGVTEIKPYQVFELEFMQNFLDEVVGIEVVRQGEVKADIAVAALSQLEGAASAVRKAYSYVSTPGYDGSLEKSESIAFAKTADADNPMSAQDVATVAFMWMKIEVGTGNEAFDSATDSTPVKATLSWADEAGNNHVMVLDDIRDYMVDGEGLVAGKSATIAVPLEAYGKLHSVSMLPYSESGTVPSVLNLHSLTVTILNPKTYTTASMARDIDKNITGVSASDAGEQINFANIFFEGSMTYTYLDGSGEARTTAAENFRTGSAIRTNAGGQVILTATNEGNVFSTDEGKFVKGSFSDVDVTLAICQSAGDETSWPLIFTNLALYSNKNGVDVLVDTNAEERQPINRIVFSAGDPSSETAVYKLTIRSREFKDKFIEFTITVPGEGDKYYSISTDAGTDLTSDSEEETDGNTEDDQTQAIIKKIGPDSTDIEPTDGETLGNE